MDLDLETITSYQASLGLKSRWELNLKLTPLETASHLALVTITARLQAYTRIPQPSLWEPSTETPKFKTLSLDPALITYRPS